ncbi:MAG: hypothetical protein ABI855_09970 [Bacteroidota bacterium]
MSRSFANFLSYIFHPLLMPFYAMLLVFNLSSYISYSISQQLQKIIYIAVFITTFVMPVLFTLFLVQKKIVGSLELEKKEERKLPYIATIFFYFVTFYFLKQLPVPTFFPIIILGAALVIIAGFFINLKWKVSVHTLGIGGVMGLTWGLSEILYIQIIIPFIILILLSGVIGTARLIRGTHSQMQIYTGLFVGFAIELLVMKYYAS